MPIRNADAVEKPDNTGSDRKVAMAPTPKIRMIMCQNPTQSVKAIVTCTCSPKRQNKWVRSTVHYLGLNERNITTFIRLVTRSKVANENSHSHRITLQPTDYNPFKKAVIHETYDMSVDGLSSLRTTAIMNAISREPQYVGPP